MTVEKIEFGGVEDAHMLCAGGADGQTESNIRIQGAEIAWHFQQIMLSTLLGGTRPDAKARETIHGMAAKNVATGAVGRFRQREMMAEVYGDDGVQQAFGAQQVEGL